VSELRLGGYGGQLADHAPPIGDVEIDGDPLLLTAGGYDVTALEPFAPKVSQGDRRFGNYQPYDSPVAQSSWHGGYGQKRAESDTDTVGYFEGHDVEADRNRIIPAPPKVWEPLPDLGSEVDARRTYTEMNGTLICTAGSHLYMRLDAPPGWVKMATFPAPCRDLAIYGERAYVALGLDTPLQHSLDLATWSSATGGEVAEALVSDRSALYRGWSNKVQATTVGTAWTEGTALIGDTSAPITSLLAGGGLVTLWVGKTDGLWGIPPGVAGTAAHYLDFDRRDPDNCWPLVWRGGIVLVPNGNGLWEYQPSSQTSGAAANISPSRDADALGQVRGRVVGVCDTLRYTIASLFDDDTQTSYVVRRDSRTGKWHSWLTMGSVEASALYFRQHDLTDAESPPHLFISAGTAGHAQVILPANGDDPISDPNCRYVIDDMQPWQPEATLPEFDFLLPDEKKTLLTVRLSSRRLMGAWRWVEVAYQLDSDGRWRTDLDAGRGALGDARSSPTCELTFPEGTQCRWVALRLRFFNMDPISPPEIRAVAIHGRVAIQTKWHWNITGVLGRAETADNLAQIERDTFLLERKLQRLREEAKPARFRDPDGYPWKVLVDRVRVTRNQEPGRLPEWQVALALTQAIPQLDTGHQSIYDYPVLGEEGGLYDTESYYWSP
jgi:hypothetical protein